MNTTHPQRVKLLAAALGGAALLTVGVSAALLDSCGSEAQVVAKTPTMSLGPTTTMALKPPTAPDTPIAVPAIRGPAKKFQA